MNKRIASLLLAVVLCFSAFILKVPTFADSTDNGLSVTKNSVSAGDTFDVILKIPAITERMSDIDLKIKFDTNAFEVASYSVPSVTGASIPMGTTISEAQANGFVSAVYGGGGDNSLDLSKGYELTVSFNVKDTAEYKSYDFTWSVQKLVSLDEEDGYTEYDRLPVGSVTTVAVAVTAPSIPAAGITLNKTTLSLVEGMSEALIATVSPSDSTDAVTWSSSNKDIAIVDADGTVTAVKRGDAAITATAGEQSAVCTVSVACAHVNKAMVESRSSTCTAQGWDDYMKCIDCGQLFDTAENEISAIPYRSLAEHAEVTDAAKEPTCTETGLTEGKHCSVCNAVLVAQETVPATSHRYDDGVITEEPTCTEKGTKTFTCQNDNSHTYTEEVAAQGHSYIAEVIAPTCTEQGFTEYTCSRCGDSYIADYTDMVDHSWGEGEIIEEAACEEDGEMLYTCTECGATKIETIPAAGHDWGDWAVTTPATCSAEGEETRVCANDESHTETRSIAIDPDAHDWDEWIVTTPATEDTEGVETRTCQNDASHTDTRATTKLGHNLSKVDAVAATCETAGSIEYYTCSGCGNLFSDAAGTIEIELADIVVEALGHKWDDGVVTTAATCTEDGVKTYTCQNDAGHTKTETIPAAGHDWGEGVITHDATCEEDGVRTYTCTRIGCGQTYTETVPATSHRYDDGVITEEPTCTEKGTKTFTCQNDNSHTYTEEVAAQGHSYIAEVIAPTCTEQGFTEYTCSRCGDSYIADYTDMVDHSWGEGEIIEEAACEEDGEMLYTCTECDATKTETIPAVGHDYVNYVCTICGRSFVDILVDDALMPGDMGELLETIELSANVSAETKEKITATVEQGHDIGLQIAVRVIGEDDLSDSDRAAVAAALASDEQAALYLTVSFMIYDETSGELLGYMTKAADSIDISVSIPQELQRANREYFALCIGEGNADRIEGLYANATFTFPADSSAAYALSYTDEVPAPTETPAATETPTPTETEEPTETSHPVVTESPAFSPKPDANSAAKQETNETQYGDDTVKTGDESQIALYIALMLLCGLGVAYLLTCRKKYRK